LTRILLSIGLVLKTNVLKLVRKLDITDASLLLGISIDVVSCVFTSTNQRLQLNELLNNRSSKTFIFLKRQTNFFLGVRTVDHTDLNDILGLSLLDDLIFIPIDCNKHLSNFIMVAKIFAFLHYFIDFHILFTFCLSIQPFFSLNLVDTLIFVPLGGDQSYFNIVEV